MMIHSILQVPAIWLLSIRCFAIRTCRPSRGISGEGRTLCAEFPIERRLIQTEPGVQVLVCSQRPAGEARGEIVMVHGLEGSGEAGYIESLSAAALRAGFRGAPLPHADLRRHGTPLRDAVSRGADQRSAGGVT